MAHIIIILFVMNRVASKKISKISSSKDALLKTWLPPEPAPGAICGYVGGVGPFYTQTTRQTVTFNDQTIRAAGVRENENDISTDSSNGGSYDIASCMRTVQKHRMDLDSHSILDNISEDSFENGYRQDVRRYSEKVMPFAQNSWRKRMSISGADRDATTGAYSLGLPSECPPGESDGLLGLSGDVRCVQFVEDDFDWRSLRSGSNSRKHTSFWMSVAIGALVLSNMFYLTAFVTNSWGVMKVISTSQWGNSERDDVKSEIVYRQWNFGLWQCCRDDGLCLGARWPGILL